ncbi:hypothetical protein FISHEDRAFT_72123 [Fistulina hepatica ATCC 64428]|uniref:Uncharacterized protein n=1 Tax=Fistulina hepatica ATCC 64428 TaxID=1128425 RepID=A0A0D7AFA9_9AGAR|nr:hypothetical protein FISHEDRAFT_72123 [Fistulina hepatica ATCC 64428]
MHRFSTIAWLVVLLCAQHAICDPQTQTQTTPNNTNHWAKLAIGVCVTICVSPLSYELLPSESYPVVVALLSYAVAYCKRRRLRRIQRDSWRKQNTLSLLSTNRRSGEEWVPLSDSGNSYSRSALENRHYSASSRNKPESYYAPGSISFPAPVAQASPFSHPGWPPSQSPNSSTSACDSPSSRDPMYGHDPFASYTTPKVAAPAPALTRAQPSISGPAPSPQSPRHPHSFPPHPPTHGAVPVPSQTLVPENPPPPYSEVGPL